MSRKPFSLASLDRGYDMTPQARAYLIRAMGRHWFANNKFAGPKITPAKAREIVAYTRKRRRQSMPV